MKPFKSKLHVLAFACALAPSLAWAESADEIMAKVDYVARKSYATQLAEVTITTCKYTLVDGNVRCSEKPRIVIADNAKKIKQAEGMYDASSLSIVREPPSDTGTSLLVYEYGQRGRENDNWLYLPALGKVSRVLANDDEGGSVFGSEFSVETTENPEGRKVYEFTYKLLNEVTYDGRSAWVIEMLPTDEKAKRTAYEKVVAWIDKETYVALREDLYRNGKVYKQRTQSGIRKIDDTYVAVKAVMNNLSSSRVSQMDKKAVRHNTEISDEFLSQRALTDFSFRERNLTRFRAELKK